MLVSICVAPNKLHISSGCCGHAWGIKRAQKKQGVLATVCGQTFQRGKREGVDGVSSPPTVSPSISTDRMKTKTGAVWYTAAFPPNDVRPSETYHVIVDAKIRMPSIEPHCVFEKCAWFVWVGAWRVSAWV